MVEEFYECNIITSNVQNIINVKNISDELSSTYTSRTPKFCLMDLTIMSFPIIITKLDNQVIIFS